MSIRSTALLITISILLSALVLTGCGDSAVKIGWMENNTPSHKSARFLFFSGTERTKICASAEETISLEYKVTVDKGTLTVALDRPDGTSYWQNAFNQKASGTLSVPVSEKGCYTLQQTGEATDGDFDFTWKITN